MDAMIPTSAFHRPLAEFIADCGGILSVRELLRRLVFAEIELAGESQRKRRSMFPFALEELDQMLVEGRAGSADLPKPRKFSSEQAAQVVYDAFSDRLILLFVDERRCTGLDEAIEVGAETRVMILRRTMLTG